MSSRRYTDEYKAEAVKQMVERMTQRSATTRTSANGASTQVLPKLCTILDTKVAIASRQNRV